MTDAAAPNSGQCPLILPLPMLVLSKSSRKLPLLAVTTPLNLTSTKILITESLGKIKESDGGGREREEVINGQIIMNLVEVKKYIFVESVECALLRKAFSLVLVVVVIVIQ